MPELWIIFTVMSGVCSIGFNFVNRYVLKDGHDSTAYSWWFEVFRFLIFIPFAFTSFNQILTLKEFILFWSIGFVEFFSIYFYMKMHSSSELSISTTITQLRLVWVPIIALIFLGEKLGVNEYFGILLVFVGQIVATFKGNIGKNGTLKYALIATVFVSLNNVLVKSASDKFFPPLILVAMALPSLFIFPLKMKDGFSRIVKLGDSKWKNVLLATIFNAGTMMFMIQAYQLGQVGKVVALFQSVLVIQVLVGILFLGERKYVGRKVVGILAVVAGAILLI
jgi:drug/metabolite transporter (DMT)-like permease